jgi:hypothetical protein
MILGWTGSRRSSLARDGSPRNPYHMALTLEWANTRLPGIFRLVEPLLRFLAKRARRKGIKELEARYCRGDDERWVHARRT